MKARSSIANPALAIALVALALGTGGVRAESLDALFDDEPSPPAKATTKPEQKSDSALKGFMQVELAHRLNSPTHWSKLRTRGELGTQSKIGSGLKWKASLRLDYDAVFDLNNRYPSDVKHNQQATARLNETYLDIGAGAWDFRLGRQHVIWGEMVGLYFADVVSARDMREFVLPDFDMQRIPQWAARAEYFKDEFHAELLWVPVATYDEIGKPGAEFFPYQPALPGFSARYRTETRPSRNLKNSNYGSRLTWLKNGWDVSGFYYHSMDTQPTFYREIVGTTMLFEPRHERISQWGGTLSKDFDSVVLKGEGVYTRGRRFGVLNPVDVDGVVAQNTLDWALGLEFTLPADARLNFQVFQRAFHDHDPDIIPEKHEDGYSLYLNKKFGSRWEAQATYIGSLNRSDWLLRPRVQWNFEKNWRLLAGVDIFKGPQLGLFGQYENRDRAYSEIRYSF